MLYVPVELKLNHAVHVVLVVLLQRHVYLGVIEVFRCVAEAD